MSRWPVETDLFGTTAAGEPVQRFTLRTPGGITARLISFGATLTELYVPGRDGRAADVVLGFDDLESYETKSPYFGATVGRVAFRIPYGRFELDGHTYRLTLNNGPHHLHGGTKGFSWVVWDARPVQRDDGPAVAFAYRSPDGDQGYPGQVDARVVYTLTAAGELRLELSATCDRPTPVDMTHHSYFNLAEAGTGDVLDHKLRIDADLYSETDDETIATGRLVAVEGTPFDFREPRRIGARFAALAPYGGGYDLAYLLRLQHGSPARVATLAEPTSGRTLDVWTDAPALVFYTANDLDGSFRGKGDQVYQKHFGLTLETAHLPDAVHHANFPSIILRPGQTYRQTCVYRFGVAAGSR